MGCLPRGHHWVQGTVLWLPHPPCNPGERPRKERKPLLHAKETQCVTIMCSEKKMVETCLDCRQDTAYGATSRAEEEKALF
jgi:hypothetical protein